MERRGYRGSAKNEGELGRNTAVRREIMGDTGIDEEEEQGDRRIDHTVDAEEEQGEGGIDA